jgi:peptidoglycan/xylan/chitin deacetylase (PgdA/CDA1 family)
MGPGHYYGFLHQQPHSPKRLLATQLRRTALTLMGAAMRAWSGGGSGIVCLHSVRDDRPAGHFWPSRELVVTSTFLDRLLRNLRRDGVQIVSLDEVQTRLESGDRGRFVAFTFDDGYADNITTALPVFKRHNAPFTVFLTTGFLDRTVPMWWAVVETLIRERTWIFGFDRVALPTRSTAEKEFAYAVLDRQFRGFAPEEIIVRLDELLAANPGTTAREDALNLAMDWDMARAGRDSGLVSYGCHTVSHPVLDALTSAQVKHEIWTARERMVRELGVVPTQFAYPYGGLDEIGADTPEIVRDAGFAAAWTTRRNLLNPRDLATPYLLPRVTLDGRFQDSRVLRAYLSGVLFALRDHLSPAPSLKRRVTGVTGLLTLVGSLVGSDAVAAMLGCVSLLD